MIKKFIYLFIFVSVLFSSEYEQWLKSQQNEYQTYKKTMDDEFSDMLKKDWEAYELTINTKQFVKPKPTTIPIAKKEVEYPKNIIEASKKVILPKEIVKRIVEKPVIVSQKPQFNPNNKVASFNFYNQKVAIQYDKKFYFQFHRISKENISDIWQHLSKTNFTTLIKQVNQYSQLYAFNDWAKYLFVYNLGLEIYQNDKNSANLFTWFVLVKMGYDTKVGYSSDTIYLLALVKQDLFQVAFFTLNNKKYFILTPNGKIDSVGAIYTYTSNYPDASNKLSFDMSNRAINITSNVKSKNLIFVLNNNQYKIKTEFSEDLIEFYKNFPQSEYQLYFSSKTSQSLSNSLLFQLQSMIKGKTELEAVNLLLHFVQTDFDLFYTVEKFGQNVIIN